MPPIGGVEEEPAIQFGFPQTEGTGRIPCDARSPMKRSGGPHLYWVLSGWIHPQLRRKRSVWTRRFFIVAMSASSRTGPSTIPKNSVLITPAEAWDATSSDTTATRAIVNLCNPRPLLRNQALPMWRAA